MQEFFKEKVDKIYSEVDKYDNAVGDRSQDITPDFEGTVWTEFQPVSEEELKQVLSELNKKECEADPIPIKLLLQVISEVTPLIHFIVNDSLKRGVFPDCIKNALVRPVIKDANGDINSLKNYRPISNLPFIS